MRRAVVRLALAALVVAVAIVGAAASGNAAGGPTLTVTKTGTPASVTRGYNVLYTITVTNGSTAANHITVTDPAPANPLPAGTTVLSASTTVGTCPALAAGATSVTCDIGQMRAGQVATLKIKVKTTTNTGVASFINRVAANLNENGNDNEPGDVVFAQTTTNLVAAGDPNFAQGYFDTGCNPNAPNDPSLLFTNRNLGQGNVQSTEACVPDFGGGTTMFLSETPHATGEPGFSEKSTICVPTTPGGSCSTPLQFTTPATFKFKLSPLELPKPFNYKRLIVFRDGVELTVLCNANGSLPAGAHACKLDPTQDKDTLVITQVVKSDSNGTWQFGP